jgi:glycosyltransferase involved in cell wall biosynthesis
MPDEFLSQPDKGVNVVGEVADAQATYDTPCVVVVPLHAGSGMRIKLAEALAAGRPIVTTSKGMEGMDLVHGEHVLVGDTADTMAQWVVKLLQEPELAVRIGTQGRQWALDHLDHRARARELTTFLKTLVRA